LYPLKCENGCCCKDEAPPKRYTVSARIMDVPQSNDSFPSFMFGISGLVLVINSYATKNEIAPMKRTLQQTIGTIPTSPRTGLPIPLVILECETAPQKNRKKHTTWEIVDLLSMHSLNTTKKISWTCEAASASTGEGLLSVSQWIGRMYNVFLTVKTGNE